MPSLIKIVFAVLVVSIFAGCSASQSVRKPTFYPNKHYKRVGDAQVEKDVEACSARADQFVAKADRRKKVASTTLKRSAVGSAVGATAGSFSGHAGRGAGIGASTGAILGLVGGFGDAAKPNVTHERFIERCLRERGYDVIGWQG